MSALMLRLLEHFTRSRENCNTLADSRQWKARKAKVAEMNGWYLLRRLCVTQADLAIAADGHLRRCLSSAIVPNGETNAHNQTAKAKG